MIELTYKQMGDVLVPDLGVTEEEQKPLGKYAMMRMNFLKEHKRILFNRLLLTGKLMEHLHEIDRMANERLEAVMHSDQRPPEHMKATNQLGWVQAMNALKSQAEETIFSELIFS